jgi:hypothetical protein
MNYLAAYIEKESVQWVVSDVDTAKILEHGTIYFSPEIESILPQIHYNYSIGFLTANLCSNIELDLPFEDVKKAEKIIPLQLQDRLPYDLENIHFTVSQTPSKIGSLFRYFITYLPKEIFEDILIKLTTIGLNLQIISSDTFLLTPLAEETVSEKKTHLTIAYYERKIFEELKKEAFISVTHEDEFLHTRKLSIPKQDNFLLPYLESHIVVSLSSCGIDKDKLEEKEFSIFLTDENNLNAKRIFSSLPNVKINVLKPEYEEGALVVNDPRLLIANSSVQNAILNLDEGKELKHIGLNNLRHSQYRFRAPKTEIKEALLDQIAPILLVLIFGIMTIIFKFVAPFKQNTLLINRANEIASFELGRNVSKGSEIQDLEADNLEIENQLGNLGGISNLSPLEWLYTLSKLIPKDLGVSIDYISISTEGLTFRGSVKEYTTTGKLDTILNSLKKSNPSKFCETNLDIDENSGSPDKKPISGEITLCQI